MVVRYASKIKHIRSQYTTRLADSRKTILDHDEIDTLEFRKDMMIMWKDTIIRSVAVNNCIFPHNHHIFSKF
jgi:hypothetical protein